MHPGAQKPWCFCKRKFGAVLLAKCILSAGHLTEATKPELSVGKNDDGKFEKLQMPLKAVVLFC